MKKHVLDVSGKLKAYSAMAASVLAADSMNGQITYTDIEPDITFDSYGDFYIMDMNTDGMPEFFLYMATNSYPGVFMFISPIVPYGSVNASTGSSVYRYPFALDAGDMISDGEDWENTPYQTMASKFYFFSGTYGNWFDVNDGYLGLRIFDDGNTYYGWARLDASEDGLTFTLKDMAYNSNAGEAICAGDKVGPSDCINEITAATWGTVTDIGNNGDGTDLGFSFNASAPETGITEYRVMVVKSSEAPSFSLPIAATMSGDQIISFTPTGAPDYSGVFAANSTDSDGDPITFGVTYKLFVYSVSADYPAVLSGGSIDITLDEPISVNEIEMLSEISISPNPSADFVTIDVSGIQSAITADLFDMSGNLIRNLSAPSGGQLKADVSNLPAGNYFIKISDATSAKVLKFVKQ